MKDIRNHSLFKKEMNQARGCQVPAPYEKLKSSVESITEHHAFDQENIVKRLTKTAIQDVKTHKEVTGNSDGESAYELHPTEETRSWNLDEAMEYAETLIEEDLGNPSTMNTLAEISNSLGKDDRDIFIKTSAARVGASKDVFYKKVRSHMKQLRQEKDTTRLIGDLIPGFPYKNLRMPPYYSIVYSKDTGFPRIVKYTRNDEEPVEVADVAIFPFKVYQPAEKATDDEPELVELVQFDYQGGTSGWQSLPQLYSADILTSAQKVKALRRIGSTVGDVNASELAAFFHRFINTNLRNMVRTKFVRKMGWVQDHASHEKVFAPFSPEFDIVPQGGKKNKVKAGVYNIINRQGTEDGALKVVEELMNDKVFLVMLAASFASPVVSLVRAELQECIGIDLSGKSSQGKTSIQKIAFSLVWGDYSPFLIKWKSTTYNGLWGTLDRANHIPVIMDDSHNIKPQFADIPHSIIDGQQGEKMQVNHASKTVEQKEKETCQNVIYFNGEVRLADKAVIEDSVGLFGRVIMIVDTPMKGAGSERVKAWVRRSLENCGQLRDRWLGFLVQKPEEEILDEVRNMTGKFDEHRPLLNPEVFDRLMYKSAVLLWSLQNAMALFGYEVDIDILVKYLAEHMKNSTSQADKVAEVVQDIALDVAENSAESGQRYHPYTPGNQRSGVYTKESSVFIISTCALKEFADKHHRQYDGLLKELLRDGYIKREKPGSYKFKGASSLSGESTQYGIAFFKSKIREKFDMLMDGESETLQAPEPRYQYAGTEEELNQLKAKYGPDSTIVVNLPVKAQSVRK